MTATGGAARASSTALAGRGAAPRARPRLAERERQIAEQQRVINEEYRLLKLRSERAIADPPLHGEWAWPPVAPKPAADIADRRGVGRRRIRPADADVAPFRSRRRSNAS